VALIGENRVISQPRLLIEHGKFRVCIRRAGEDGDACGDKRDQTVFDFHTFSKSVIAAVDPDKKHPLYLYPCQVDDSAGMP
jgi:hypothetical protein